MAPRIRMGLQLYVGRQYGMGVSYSGCHALRARLVRAAIRYLEQRLEDDDTALQVLRSWLRQKAPAPPLTEIDYRAVVRPSARTVLATAGLLGLCLFVDHSDCDGIHTPSEAADIVQSLELIREAHESLYPQDADQFDYLLKVYSLAAKTQTEVRFI